MLAHQLGSALPKEAANGIWNWEKLWKECAAIGGPGHQIEFSAQHGTKGGCRPL